MLQSLSHFVTALFAQAYAAPPTIKTTEVHLSSPAAVFGDFFQKSHARRSDRKY